MGDQYCDNCRFWNGNSYRIEDYRPQRESCRRFPPMRLIMDDCDSPRDVIDHADKDSSWWQPITNCDDWCGEWQEAKEA